VRALGEWQGGGAPSGLSAGGSTACLSDERRGGGGVCLSRRSEQAADDAVFVHVNIFGGGMAGQAGHGVDFSREGDDKAGSGGEADFSYRERIAARGTEQRFVVRNRILGFGDADRQAAVAPAGELCQIAAGGSGKRYPSGAVYAAGNGADFVGKREGIGVEQAERTGG